MFPIRNAVVAGILIFGAAMASAQSPAQPGQAQAPAPVAAPPASPPAAPIEVTPAEEGLSAKAQQLSTMDSDLALAIKRLQLGTTSVQQQEVDRKLGAVRSGVNSVPELVGVSGVGTRLVAEFLSNNAIVRARAGEWITAEWKVHALTANQVALKRRGSGTIETINFGHRPVTASELASDLAALNRGTPANAPAPESDYSGSFVPAGQ